MIEDLERIVDQMERFLPKFVESRSFGHFLPGEFSAEFKAALIEAYSILDHELGKNNVFSQNLTNTLNEGSVGFIGGPSYACVREAVAIIRSGMRELSRRNLNVVDKAGTTKNFVDPERISALNSIVSADWDFRRLAELCRETNVAFANQCHLSTAMLVRAILDHVPPVFGCEKFSEVANNYGEPNSDRSFKRSMRRLQESLRNIADRHLHSPIKQREDLPTATQVDFAADLDVLLGEVIRVVSIARS